MGGRGRVICARPAELGGCATGVRVDQEAVQLHGGDEGEVLFSAGVGRRWSAAHQPGDIAVPRGDERFAGRGTGSSAIGKLRIRGPIDVHGGIAETDENLAAVFGRPPGFVDKPGHGNRFRTNAGFALLLFHE